VGGRCARSCNSWKAALPCHGQNDSTARFGVGFPKKKKSDKAGSSLAFQHTMQTAVPQAEAYRARLCGSGQHGGR